MDGAVVRRQHREDEASTRKEEEERRHKEEEARREEEEEVDRMDTSVGVIGQETPPPEDRVYHVEVTPEVAHVEATPEVAHKSRGNQRGTRRQMSLHNRNGRRRRSRSGASK